MKRGKAMDEHETAERVGERYQRLLKENRVKQQRIFIRFLPFLFLIFAIIGFLAWYFFPQQNSSLDQAQKVLKLIDYQFLLPPEEVDSNTIVAVINNVAITRSDVDIELLYDLGTLENVTWVDRERTIEKIAARLLLAQEAIKSSYHLDPNFLAATKRNYIEMLARRYLTQNIRSKSWVTLDQVKSYVIENPLLFENRKHYSFDAIDIAPYDFDRLGIEGRAILSKTTSTQALLDLLKKQNITFIRNPFSFYSEQMPPEMLGRMDKFEDGKTAFFIKELEYIRIVRVTGFESRPITGDQSLDLARQRLTEQAITEEIVTLEAQLIDDLTEKLKPRDQLEFFTNETMEKERESTQKPTIGPALDSDKIKPPKSETTPYSSS